MSRWQSYKKINNNKKMPKQTRFGLMYILRQLSYGDIFGRQHSNGDIFGREKYCYEYYACSTLRWNLDARVIGNKTDWQRFPLHWQPPSVGSMETSRLYIKQFQYITVQIATT